MKRLIQGFALSLALAWTSIAAASAGIAESDLRRFEIGKTTYDQVIAALGQPTRREVSDEGLQGAAYLGDGAWFEPNSIFVFAGAVNGVFVPGARSGGVTSNGSVAVLIFDRNGALMFYRAVGGAKPVSSNDDATTLPNVKLTLRADQRQSKLPLDDGKPHLGIQPVPVAELDAQHRTAFAAARFNGLVIANVIPGSAAAKAGIANGDYLYAINGMLVTSLADASKAMAEVKTGDTILVRAKRIDEATNLVKEQVFVVKF